MRYAAMAAAALLASESAALACSCLATDDPAELKRFAAEAAEDAVALVEVEALTSYQQTPAGEQMRVIRTLGGSAPAEFRIERGPAPSSASCDILYEPGQRDVIILYPATQEPNAAPVFRASGLCMDHLLDKPVFLDALRARMAAPATGERG